MPVHFCTVFSVGNGVSQGRMPQVSFDFSFLLGCFHMELPILLFWELHRISTLDLACIPRI